MAPQVEHSEETLSDETQPRPEKCRCLCVYLRVCMDARVCLGAGFHAHACAYLPGKDHRFFVFHVKHFGLGDSGAH